MNTIRFYVRTVHRDGTVTLSHPFLLESKAIRWARLARRDAEHVTETLVIVRRVRPIETPTQPAA
jgi:hypothetical protein